MTARLASGAPRPRTAPPFVGRSRELEWLERCLETALAGQPQVALLIGEAGIGKTRLVRELQARARQRGVETLAGRGFPEFTAPFLPFIEALSPRLRELPAALERSLGADAALVRGLLRDGPAPRADQPDGPAHGGVHLAMARAVVELARLGPLLLVLDDLHCADQASLDLFGHLVLTLADAAGRDPVPLLLIGSTRPLAGEPGLARSLGRFQREAICQTLELGGLDEGGVRQLLEGLGLARASHQLVAAVNDATHGHPLFVQEVAHRLSRGGGAAAGGYADIAAGPLALYLPADVVAAITARVRDLDDEARSVLTIAACVGDPFTTRVLAAVTGRGEGELARLLDDAQAQGVLLGDPAGFQFAHALIRQVFYGELPAPARQRAHAQIAAVLVRMHGGSRGDEHVLAIAHHLVAGGPAVDPAMTFTYARRAAERAFAGSAWRDAARYYQAALQADDLAHRLTPAERAALHYQTGVAHFRDQDAGPCLAQFEQAIAGFAACGDARGEARAQIGKTRAHLTLASVGYGTLVDSAPLRAAAARLADDDPGLCGALWAELAQVFWTARQPAEAEAMARRAVAQGERLGDDALAAEALRALWLVQSQTMDVPGAFDSLERGLALARRSGDVWVESHLQQRAPLTLVWLGRLDAVAVAAERAAELTRATHDWGDHSLALGAQVCLAVARGDFDAAERWAQEATVMRRRSGYPWAGPTVLPALACARVLRGDCVAAEQALTELATPGQVFDEPGAAVLLLTFLLQTVVQAHADASDAGRSALRERVAGLAAASTSEAADVYAIGVFGALVDLADLLAEPTFAGAALDPLARAHERGVRLSSGWVGLVARQLGVIATLQRAWPLAAGWFDTALEEAHAMQARPELARTCVDYGRMLIARGRRADRDRAAELLGQAGGLCQTLGLVPLARQTSVLAESLAPRAAAGPRRAAGLTRREEDLLVRVARGRRDSEIARELVLDPAAVERGVRRVLARIGAATRAEAAAYAQRRGLVAALPAGGPAHGLRIILFTDMEGSTELFQRLGDAPARAMLREHDAIIRDWLQRCGGTELKHTGDGVMASFDAVAAATACAVGIQRTLGERNARHPERTIKVRIGLNAGAPIAEEGQLFGAAVNAAARICAQARAGQILVAESVRRLAADAGQGFVDRGLVALRGFAQRFRLYEVPW